MYEPLLLILVLTVVEFPIDDTNAIGHYSWIDLELVGP